ncbi:hypothetical protein KSP39_PZI016507 [Platanthera zijinensis]|uniref:Uncharacterized protein n=1 Tax=Platanthera zijinensis TaxID=2320716 RepID=A0AAP0B7Q4_9ASPA
MAKNGKLSKLRGMIKRWNSSSRIHRAGGSCAGSSARSDEDDEWRTASFTADKVPAGFHPVYVGKSRRRYIVSSELVDHPRFKNLVEGSGGGGDTIVGCEVVLFEHLLWMLENADHRTESLDELVDFYAW